MIIVTPDNMHLIMKIALKSKEQYVKDRTLKFCNTKFREEILLNKEINKLSQKLSNYCVNPSEEFAKESKKYNYTFNTYDYKYGYVNFSFKISLPTLEEKLSETNAISILENTPIVNFKAHRYELDLDDDKFNFTIWDTEEQSIEFLETYCDIFNAALPTINNALIFYKDNNATISSILCLSDTLTSSNSSYLITIGHNKEYIFKSNTISINESTPLLQLIINHNASHKDIIAYNPISDKVEHILPLEGESPFSIRKFTPIHDNLIKSTIRTFTNHKNTLIKNV